jgi:hypothetical protein
VSVTIAAAGKWPDFAIPRNGLQYHYWYNGGAIEGAIWDGHGASAIEGGITAVASGVDDSAISVTFDEPSRRFYLAYRSTGGAVVMVKSADGVNWS